LYPLGKHHNQLTNRLNERYEGTLDSAYLEETSDEKNEESLVKMLYELKFKMEAGKAEKLAPSLEQLINNSMKELNKLESQPDFFKVRCLAINGFLSIGFEYIISDETLYNLTLPLEFQEQVSHLD